MILQWSRSTKYLLLSVLVLLLITPYLLGLPLGKYHLIADFRHPIPSSPLYYLKLVREFNQSLFIIGPEDQSFWHYTLAEKRLAEAEYLQQHGLASLSTQQLDLAKMHRDQADQYLPQLIDRVDTNYLIQLQQGLGQRISTLVNNY